MQRANVGLNKIMYMKAFFNAGLFMEEMLIWIASVPRPRCWGYHLDISH